jgi:hypothetical protein
MGAAAVSNTNAPAGSDRSAESLPFFPVGTHKFVVLSIVTFGIYEMYWAYQNWKRIKTASGQDLSPFWRAIFAPMWGFSLFERVRTMARNGGIDVGWNADSLAILYLLLTTLAWRLPDPLWLLALVSVVPLLPVHQTTQLANERVSSSAEAPNRRYSVGNVMTIVLGGLLLILVVIGAFLPNTPAAEMQ